LDDIVARLRQATLGEYEIGRALGRGGMAAVFSAHDLALDRKVAIKVMSPGLVLGEGMTERFKQEAITVAQLHHPSIVSVYSVRQAEGLHFFVMQYVEGRSLEQVLQQARRLPLPMVRSILYQVGSALAYAHRARVVHRDVKPANILIDQDGNAVVTDFGIAKAAERPVNTLTGALVGTPAYMSPEQCAGGEVSGLSDQYSLGAVAYEMVTGEAPFAGSTLTVMQAHVERAPRPIADLSPDCPPEVAAAIHRMLEKDPAARWPRMVDALTALGAEALPEEHQLRGELARQATGTVSVPSDPTTPTSPVPRSRRSGRISAPYRSVGGISIMPAPAGLEVGDSFTLVAVLRGQHGTRLPPRAVEWSADDPTVLRLDGRTALATGLAPGTTIVTATCKNVSARLRVDVSAPRADDIVIEPLHEPLQAG
jgi:serine/threonine-protein kinase